MSIVEIDGLSAADLQTLSQLPTIKSILGRLKLVAGNFPTGFQAEAITVNQLIEVFKSAIQTPVDNLADIAYPTLAEALTHMEDLPKGTVILITNDGENNGLYLSDGATLNKTEYDAIVLSDVFSDIQTIMDVVNGVANTKAVSRLGRDYWTLATLDALIENGLLKIENLQDAIDIAAAAGAGANGWTASLVVDASGINQQQINDKNKNSLFRVNGKAVGLVPFSNISATLSNFLNSNDVKEIYLDGEYILQDQIVVSAGVSPKKIFCSDSTILKPMVTGNLPLFDLYSSVEFYNATFDYQNGNCFTTLRYRPNCGLVKLRDIKIKNIKDMVSSYGTTIFSISTEGNKLDIDGISFENCLKLGNGNITDSAGSLNGVYYFGTTGLIRGEIKNIYAKDFHNINASSQIIIEDTAVVYIATGGTYIPLTVENVIGDEFGKRLVKIQASGLSINNLRGTSTVGDSLSVVGILSEPASFISYGNTVNGVYARGNISYAFADSGVGTYASNLDIDLFGSNALNDGDSHFGAYFGGQASSNTLKNSKIKAKRPIGIYPGLVTDSIQDLQLIDLDLELKDNGSIFINIPGNQSTNLGSIKRLYAKLKLRSSSTRTTNSMLISTFGVDKGYSDFNFDVEFIDKSSSSNSTQALVGTLYFVKNLNINAKFIADSGLAPNQIGDLATINNSSNVFVHINSEQKFNRGIVAVANNGFKVSKDFKLGECAIGQVVAAGSGTKYEVPDSVLLYNGLTEPREILRGYGTTAQRPLNAAVGFNYFDTTIAKQIFLKSVSPQVWVEGYAQVPATAPYDPPSLAAGATQSTVVSLTGAAIGQPAVVAFSQPLQATRMWAEVTAANTVTVYHNNPTAAAVDVASGTLSVKLV